MLLFFVCFSGFSIQSSLLGGGFIVYTPLNASVSGIILFPHLLRVFQQIHCLAWIHKREREEQQQKKSTIEVFQSRVCYSLGWPRTRQLCSPQLVAFEYRKGYLSVWITIGIDIDGPYTYYCNGLITIDCFTYRTYAEQKKCIKPSLHTYIGTMLHKKANKFQREKE